MDLSTRRKLCLVVYAAERAAYFAGAIALPSYLHFKQLGDQENALICVGTAAGTYFSPGLMRPLAQGLGRTQAAVAGLFLLALGLFVMPLSWIFGLLPIILSAGLMKTSLIALTMEGAPKNHGGFLSTFAMNLGAGLGCLVSATVQRLELHTLQTEGMAFHAGAVFAVVALLLMVAVPVDLRRPLEDSNKHRAALRSASLSVLPLLLGIAALSAALAQPQTTAQLYLNANGGRGSWALSGELGYALYSLLSLFLLWPAQRLARRLGSGWLFWGGLCISAAGFAVLGLCRSGATSTGLIDSGFWLSFALAEAVSMPTALELIREAAPDQDDEPALLSLYLTALGAGQVLAFVVAPLYASNPPGYFVGFAKALAVTVGLAALYAVAARIASRLHGG